MAVFGSGTPVSKLVTDDFPALLATGLRVALGAVVLVPAMLVARLRRGCDRLIPRLPGRDLAVLVGIAVLGILGFSILMLYGMRHVTGAVGSVVMATTPAVTAAAAVIFMRDRLDLWRGAGIALAVAGVAIVNLLGGVGGGSGDLLWLGTLLVLGAVCGEAAYTLLGKRLSADITPLEVAALGSALGALLFLPFIAWQGAGVDWPSAAGDWAALAWWGLGTLALGSVLWYSGVQRVPGVVASGFMGVMPVSALVLSYLLLGEAFAPAHLAGMALVLAGIAAVVRSHARSG